MACPRGLDAPASWGYAGASVVACVANFTPVPRDGYRVGLPWAGEWQILIDSDAPGYDGSGFRDDAVAVTATTEVAWQHQPASAVIDVPPLGVLLLGGRRP